MSNVVFKATSLDSFKTAINNLEYVIDFSGEDAQKAISKLDSGKKINTGGKIVTGVIVAAAIVGSGGLLGFLAAGAGTVGAVLTRNMKKYDVEILSENHAIFTLKEKYRKSVYDKKNK